jgi:acetyltransferase-like isoleucine patch superfamily enzyme
VEDGVFIAPGLQTANSKNMGGRAHSDKERLIEAKRIERGARIGSGVVINPAVIIGQEALIGSGAVVTKSIPPFAIAIGVPARLVGEVPIDDRIDWNSVASKFPNK